MALAAGLAIGGTLCAQPIITEVVDVAGYTANIAQGSLFLVKGRNLSSPGLNLAPSLPLGATLANVRVTITPPGSSTITDAFMHYTYDAAGINQLSAVLPSTLAPGSYDIRVVNAGATSAPFRTTVVARKFGILTQDTSGSGQAVVQGFISQSRTDLNRLTTGALAGTPFTHSPARPGQIVTIWGVGLGPLLSGADNVAPGAQDFKDRATIRVLVGGQSITPDLYAGRAPEFPGADSIILTLPNNVPTGCAVSLQVSVDGQLSNPTTMAIAPAGADACVSSTFSRDTLIRLDQGGSLTTGNFVLASFATTQNTPLGNLAVKIETANGAFSRFSGAQLASASTFTNEPGACQVFRRVGNQEALLFGGSPVNLDAGANITLAGPNVVPTNNQLKRQDPTNTYSLSLGTTVSGITLPVPIPGFNSSPIIGAGTYTLTGTGGNGVGAFTARVTLGAPLTIGTLPGTINRSQPLNLTWSGGAASDLVQIIGTSGAATGGLSDAPVFDAGVFVCTTTNTGNFTVPASVLAQLPVTPAGNTGIGTIMLISNSVPTASSGLFTAPLIGGGNIDMGVFLGTVGSLATTRYQ